LKLLKSGKSFHTQITLHENKFALGATSTVGVYNFYAFPLVTQEKQ